MYVALGCVVVGAGCDLTVTNPGPVQDRFLAEPASHPALVHGAGKALVQAMNSVVLTSAYLSREVFPTGTIGPGSPGGQILQRALIDDNESGGEWNALHTARYVGEHAAEILEETDGDAALLTRANIYAGFANKMLGEHFCEVTYDGGGIEPAEAALERAEAQFTAALETATGELRLQALAGRAQARVLLQNWAGAAADAEQVPLDFEGLLPTDGIVGSAGVQNNVWMVVAAVPYRGHTTRFTFFEEYYTQTRDPRVAWETVPGFPVGNTQLQGYGPVPFARQSSKNNAPNAPYRLASGREMQLIRAEAILQQNPASWSDALALINGARTSVRNEDGAPLEGWSASSLDETWDALMRERGIEVWLEGKRMGDLRRWKELNVPGDVDAQLPQWDHLSPGFFATEPSRCMPIPRSEQLTNPNITEGECEGCGVQFGSGQGG